ncbi:HAD family hydrolase [Corallococcus sp. CA041A]|uniref:HAD family hydrolase n=1 Tax=Corallococcus sp. CA041A TaxID=2316727 RepID=UPI000EA00A48|nr:HAD family hydrolase [Corallococcus sp. CA041A]RKH19775.1 HAD family hydrolase [Corallococcus sp. CA041A]
MRLLITDLDNTLYDWVSFFARAFEAMAHELTKTLELDPQSLFQEFREVHRKHGDSEYPFAVFELPTVKEKFGTLPEADLKKRLDSSLHAFNSARHRELRLYDSVETTLKELSKNNVLVIGYTEALAENAHFRLQKLGIAQYFHRLYALEAKIPLPPRATSDTSEKSGFIKRVSRDERKPNPALLTDICAQEHISLQEACYVGDSLSRDILMAQSAGVTSAWAEYGTKYDPSLWGTLVKISHWTEEDIARDSELRRQTKAAKPDYIINSFSDLIPIMADEK